VRPAWRKGSPGGNNPSQAWLHELFGVQVLEAETGHSRSARRCGCIRSDPICAVQLWEDVLRVAFEAGWLMVGEELVL
jgi:hypothetical protein